MPLVKYRIYELSARAVISYGREQDGAYTFRLSAAETEKCRSRSAPHEQDDNALFYQIMCVLHGDAFTGTPGGQLVTDLSDIIFYMDFSGIFDRSGARKKYLIRQEKAKALFRPDGVSLDFGSGPHRYLAFERSGSMSRQARLSFIREDFYDAVRRRIMMDMTIGDCQLSKLYAYNGLMLSSGIRIDGIGIDRPHRVVVVDNPVRTPPPTEVITVEDDGTQNSTRKYHRVETMADVEVTCFDGEGLISKEYARVVDEKLCGKKVHTSFQIRIYLRDDVTDAQIIANLLSNPVKALIESGFFFYNEDSHVFSVSPDIWSTIDISNKAAITRICRQKLKDYYKD